MPAFTPCVTLRRMKRILTVIATAAVIALVAGYFLIARVPADTIAFADTGRPGDTPTILGPGFHLRPVGSNLVLYSTSPVTAVGDTLVTPSTGGEIPARFTVTARIDPAHAATLHGPIAGRSLEDFLSAQAGILLRQYASSAGAVEILTPRFREQAAAAIVSAMKNGGMAEASMVIGPPDADTLLAAAQFLAPQGEASKIRQTVMEALAAPGGGGNWKLHTAMGLVNESERHLADCEKNYLDALAIEPAALPPMTQLVALYTAVGEYPKLRRVVDAALTSSPKSVPHLNWAAMVLLKDDDFKGAERLLKEGLAVEPQNELLLSNLAGVYLKTGKPEEAVSQLRLAVEAAPTNPQGLFNLGSTLASLGRFDEALPLLEQAEQNGPLNLALARALAGVHEKLGHAKEAAAYLKKAKELEAAQEDRKRKAAERHGTSQPAKGTSPK